MSKWKYLRDSNMIYNKEARYEIWAEELTSSAEALDFILQIAGKSQPELWDVAGFIEALEEATEFCFGKEAQAVFCPRGKGRRVNWRTLRRLERLHERPSL